MKSRVPIGDDPYRSASHGKPTAVWCLTMFGPVRVDLTGTHTHMCVVDVYREMDHEHRCRCGERAV